MIPFKIGDKEFELPTRHGELTLNQFNEIRKGDSTFVDFISLISGLDKEFILNSQDLNLDLQIAEKIEWIKKPHNYKFPLPLFVEHQGKKFAIPTIGSCNFGQKIAIETAWNKAAKEGRQDLDITLEALCIYFQPLLLSKKFDDNFMEIAPIILDWKIEVALPVASFFLQSWAMFVKENPKNSQVNTRPTKSMQELTGWRNLVYSQLLSICLRASISGLMKFSKWTTIQSLRLCGLKKNKPTTKDGLVKS